MDEHTLEDLAKSRYWLFAYNSYYPGGGMGDFVSAHPSEDEARAARSAMRFPRDNAEIVDVLTREIVWSD